MKNIKIFRKKIDKIDKQIIKLLNERAKNVLEIAKIKDKNFPVYDPARETQILRSLKKHKGILGEKDIESIYNEIFSVSRFLQKKEKIVYLGPPTSYTHLAAIQRFGSKIDYVAVNSIKDVFLEVEKGNCDYGCVPIENSTEGAVNYTYDMFVDFDLKIYSEILLQIRHNLLSKEKDIKKIKTIFAHPQSFSQCRLWLESNLPKIALKEVSSNSKGAELASQKKGTAAIASKLAADYYGLNILAESIEDMPDNITRFFVISNSIGDLTGNDKTSIMVSIKDKVGALYSLLKPFAKYKINLTNIESRPSKKKAWDYYFFVDFEGHVNDKKVKIALKEIEKECGSIKVLGSYPKF